MKFTKLLIPVISLAFITCGAKKAHFDVLPIGGDFTLTDQDSNTFKLSDQKGALVLLFFGYTHCPDACPMTMAKIGSAYEKLGSQAKNIKTVFITVDPARDNVSTMKDYAEGFQASFSAFKPIALTGTEKEVRQVINLFKGFAEKRSGISKSGYTMDHTTSVFIIDQQNRVRFLFNPNENVSQLLSVLTLLLES